METRATYPASMAANGHHDPYRSDKIAPDAGPFFNRANDLASSAIGRTEALAERSRSLADSIFGAVSQPAPASGGLDRSTDGNARGSILAEQLNRLHTVLSALEREIDRLSAL